MNNACLFIYYKPIVEPGHKCTEDITQQIEKHVESSQKLLLYYI